MSIYFYKEFGELGYLANYAEYSFIVDGVLYKTAEHYYQSKKFFDVDIVNKIINAKDAYEAAAIGRDKNNPLRTDWEEVKIRIMYEAVYQKFKQNKDICDKLLSTRDEKLIEATTKEDFWGCGPNRTGQNNYGIILEKVREQLFKEQNK